MRCGRLSRRRGGSVRAGRLVHRLLERQHTDRLERGERRDPAGRLGGSARRARRPFGRGDRRASTAAIARHARGALGAAVELVERRHGFAVRAVALVRRGRSSFSARFDLGRSDQGGLRVIRVLGKGSIHGRVGRRLFKAVLQHAQALKRRARRKGDIASGGSLVELGRMDGDCIVAARDVAGRGADALVFGAMRGGRSHLDSDRGMRLRERSGGTRGARKGTNDGRGVRRTQVGVDLMDEFDALLRGEACAEVAERLADAFGQEGWGGERACAAGAAGAPVQGRRRGRGEGGRGWERRNGGGTGEGSTRGESVSVPAPASSAAVCWEALDLELERKCLTGAACAVPREILRAVTISAGATLAPAASVAAPARGAVLSSDMLPCEWKEDVCVCLWARGFAAALLA